MKLLKSSLFRETGFQSNAKMFEIEKHRRERDEVDIRVNEERERRSDDDIGLFTFDVFLTKPSRNIVLRLLDLRRLEHRASIPVFNQLT